MWAYSFELRWKEAYRYADLLCKENKWSQVQQPAPPRSYSCFSTRHDLLICWCFAGCLCISKSSHSEHAARGGGGSTGGECGRGLQVGYRKPLLACKNSGCSLETVDCLQAGGRSQDEDCREIHSDGEVCGKEGGAVQFTQPCQTTCPCSGEKAPSHQLLLNTLLQHLSCVLCLHRK